jgi:hypothetical protein
MRKITAESAENNGECREKKLSNLFFSAPFLFPSAVQLLRLGNRRLPD